MCARVGDRVMKRSMSLAFSNSWSMLFLMHASVAVRSQVFLEQDHRAVVAVTARPSLHVLYKFHSVSHQSPAL